MWIYKFVVRFIVFWGKITGCKMEGLENLPREGATVTMANHSHVMDPFLVAAAWWQVDRYVRFMSKKEFFDNKFLAYFMYKIGMFPVSRGEADIAALKTALGILKNKEVLGVFPEGTRNKNTDGTLLEFKQGATMVAYKSKAVIVPVAIINSGNLFKFWCPRPKLIITKSISFVDESRPAKEIMTEYTELIRGNIGLQFGDIPKLNWPQAPNEYLQFIQEANIGVSPYKNSWIDAGYFLTHIGGEGIIPKYNFFMSVSLLTYYEPIYQSGIKYSYSGKKFYSSLMLLNGYNVLVDNNKNKSFGLQIGYKPSDKADITIALSRSFVDAAQREIAQNPRT